jgi:signal transduction histidine kinase
VDFLFKPIEPHMLITKVNVFFELHRRRQELAKQLRERTEALRINEMFMAVLSHDLRNPLQIIKTVATLLKRRPDEDKMQEFAERLMGSSQRMGRMIEDLLDVTRIRQAGGLRLSPAPFDLDALCAEAVAEMRSCFPERTLEYRLEGKPQGTWDGERLAQVLSNILGNAVQHGDPSEPIVVSLDGTRPEAVVLTVTNGGTIPGDLLPMLFSPFRGGERRPGQAQGLGLGLYIAQQIVRSHGGEIEVRSEHGHTCFEIVLPRCAEKSILQAAL